MRKTIFTFSRVLILFLSLQGSYFSLAKAQGVISADGSMGTQVTQNGNVQTITGGTRPSGGGNLFHSFGEFGVPTNNVANFLNDSGLPTINILSRVTGGNPSNILGTIQTQGFGNANLFLMNPAGIVFGKDATLNVGGATHFTTADYLQLSDGVQFTALPSAQDALLSVAPVAAFGFLESNPASLVVQESMLSISEGKTLSLVGGDIDISGGSLKSADGRINLVSLNSPGTVNIGDSGDLQVNASQLGRIAPSNNASVNVDGESGGSIMIRGGQLIMDGSQISANATGSPSVEMAGPSAAEMAGTSGYGIDIDVSQDVVLKNQSRVAADVGGSRNGRDIRVMAGGNLKIVNSNMRTLTFTEGNAGSIEVHADKVVFNIDRPGPGLDISGITSLTGGAGNAGNIQVQANNFEMFGGLLASFTFGAGNAGNIGLTVTNDITMIGNDAGGNILTNVVPFPDPNFPPPTGNAGNILIQANNFTMTNDSQIQALTVQGGTAGTVQIFLKGNLELKEGSAINSDTLGGGAAGDITIIGKNATLIGVPESVRPMLGPTEIAAGTQQGGGQGGNINLTFDNLTMTSNAAIRTFTSGSAAGGNINVSTQNTNITNGAIVTAESTSSSPDAGNAGDIQLTATDTILINKATVTTEADQASGGNIKLTANDMIQLVDSTISSSVQGDENTGGGDINLDPDFIILQNSQILAKANAGQGGNISIIASKAVLLDSQSTLNASSQTGISGSVTIESPIQVLSGTIAPLPDQPVNVATLYATRCVAGEGGHFSTFVDSKSDSVAPTPGTFLASPLMLPSVQAKADNSVSQKSPIMLTASIAPLVLGHAGEFTTACP